MGGKAPVKIYEWVNPERKEYLMASRTENSAVNPALPATWFWLGVLWVVGILLVIMTVHQYAEDEILGDMEDEALVVAEKLRTELIDYQDIAASVAGLNTVAAVLSGNSGQEANLNRFLKKMNHSLGSEFLYIINPTGHVVGASNALAESSFLGTSLAFRPYFQQSMLGEPARYYARGISSGTRGLFFSAPVIRNGEALGVAVVKLSLEQVFKQLSAREDGFLVVGYDGVIFAASDSDWEQKTLYPLADTQRQVIRDSRRYGNANLIPVGNNSSADVFDNNYIYLQSGGLSRRYLMRRALVEEAGWHVLAVSPLTQLYKRILMFCLYYSLVVGILVLLQLYWRKRSEVQKHIEGMNQELERRVGELTQELTQSNDELRDLVDHYRHTQQQLQETQDQLIQAAKLAVLGEMSAGINHELNQPLLALQTYNENSLRLMAKDKPEMVVSNLREMQQILSTMQGIVSRLKVFSRRSPPEPRVVQVSEVLNGVMGIMTPILKKSAVEIELLPENFDGQFYAEPIQVQQVLVNLLTNAAEAMADQQQAKIKVELVDQDGALTIRVADCGPGIAPEMRNKIFEPFYTTKSTGLGIGLALSRRIIETLSGSLTLAETEAGGSTFVLTLPKCAPAEGKSK